MPSQTQIAAARRNGPKTPAGLRKSSLNATRHGLFAQTLVLPHESRDQFDQLHLTYTSKFQSAGEVESDRIKSMVATKWRKQRAWAFETSTLELELDFYLALAYDSLTNNSKTLAQIIRAEATYSRQYDGALIQFLKLPKSGPVSPPVERLGAVLQNEPSPKPASTSPEPPLQNEPDPPAAAASVQNEPNPEPAATSPEPPLQNEPDPPPTPSATSVQNEPSPELAATSREPPLRNEPNRPTRAQPHPEIPATRLVLAFVRMTAPDPLTSRRYPGDMVSRVTRRQLAATVAAAAVLKGKAPPASQPIPANPDEELKAARDRMRRFGEQLAKVSLPQATGPAVHFRA